MRVLLALVCALAASPAWAKGADRPDAGVPALDTRDETAVVGRGASKPNASASSGNWQASPAALELAKADKNGAWWLSGQAESALQDGFVRARLQFEPSGGGALLLRAHAETADKLSTLHGYAVGVFKGKLELRRLQGGAATTLAGGHPVACKGGCSLEIAAWLIGPHMVVHAYDGETLKELATLTASDATMPKGQIGVRFQGDSGAKCTGLWFRRASADLPVRGGALGRTRYLAVPVGLRAQLAGLGTKTVSSTDSTLIVQTDACGKEAILRRVPDALEVYADEPMFFSDASLREAAANPVVPTPSGFAIDRSYKDPAMTEALLRAYAKRFGDVAQLLEIGRTHQGRPLLALRLHKGSLPADEVPQVLINGAHHGVELAALEFALDGCAWLMEHHADDDNGDRWLRHLTVWCVPLVNPDGNYVYMHVSRHGGRKNGRDTDGNGRIDPTDGVDLNRNYPFRWHSLGEIASHSDPRRAWYRGTRPASEPETQAMMRLGDAVRFVSSVSYHTNANAVLVPYTIPEAKDPEPNEGWKVAQAMADRAGTQVNGRPLAVRRRLYPVDGVDQDWYRAAHGTSAFLVEGTLTNPGLERLRKMVLATRGTWMGLLDRTLEGPGIAGRVVDARGQPVVAEIRVAEVALRDGEHWTSRCQDGRFARLLDAAGPYTVQAVDAAGKIIASAAVQVTNGKLTNVELVAGAGGDTPSSCSRPDLCSIDSACAAEARRCVVPGQARFCRIEGKCVERGATSPTGRCNPDVDPWAWTAG